MTEVPGAGIALTRAEADLWGKGFVGRLRAQGVEPGSRIAFCAANSPQLLAAVFGCLQAGLAPVVMSAVLTPSELEGLLTSVDASAVIDDAACQDMVEPPESDDLDLDLADWFSCRPLHFTSGTSGHPKAVWSGWLSREDSLRYSTEEQQLWQFSAEDWHLVCAPLSHSAPLRFALQTLLAHGSVLVPARFEPKEVAALIETGAVTTTFMAPAHLQRLLDTSRPSTHQVRLLAHAGSQCPPSLKQAAISAFGQSVVVEFYGSTEGQFTVCPAADWQSHPGTVGRARPGRELRIIEGQIWCRAPDFARFEYWGDTEKTASAWDGDWFTVGDLGRLDDDGFLYLEGRRSDLIISGGVNVYPAEVERVLRGLAGLEDVFVFGTPDEQWGDRVCAAVAGTVSEQQVRQYANEHLAPYKRPKTILMVTDLPITHSGKVDRSRLLALLPGE